MLEKVHPVIFSDEIEIPVKRYKKKELRELYGFSKNTLNLYIEKHLEKFSAIGYNKWDKSLSSDQVRLFFQIFGHP